MACIGPEFAIPTLVVSYSAISFTMKPVVTRCVLKKQSIMKGSSLHYQSASQYTY